MRDGPIIVPLPDGLPVFLRPDHAERRDWRTARIIYQAQALRRRFGKRTAQIFLTTKRVPFTLGMRVMSLTDQQLRR